MPAAHLMGQKCTGHGPWGPRPNIKGSSNVFVEGTPWHRQGDGWSPHCVPLMGCHGGVTAKGSSTVMVNGKQAARMGDLVACGSFCMEGAKSVFAGG